MILLIIKFMQLISSFYSNNSLVAKNFPPNVKSGTLDAVIPHDKAGTQSVKTDQPIYCAVRQDA